MQSGAYYEMLNAIRGVKPSGVQLDKFEKQLESWATTVINFMYYVANC